MYSKVRLPFFIHTVLQLAPASTDCNISNDAVGNNYLVLSNACSTQFSFFIFLNIIVYFFKVCIKSEYTNQ